MNNQGRAMAPAQDTPGTGRREHRGGATDAKGLPVPARHRAARGHRPGGGDLWLRLRGGVHRGEPRTLVAGILYPGRRATAGGRLVRGQAATDRNEMTTARTVKDTDRITIPRRLRLAVTCRPLRHLRQSTHPSRPKIRVTRGKGDGSAAGAWSGHQED